MKNTEQEFLNFLGKDIEEHPENVHEVPIELWENIQDLLEGVEVNLNEPLEDE